MIQTIAPMTPPRQVLARLSPNAATPPQSEKVNRTAQESFDSRSPCPKRSRTPDCEGIGSNELSKLHSPARYHHPSSIAHWSNKNRKGMKGKGTHTLMVGDSPEKEIRAILEHVRGKDPQIPFQLPSGNEVRWENNELGIYSGDEKIRTWGVHRTQDGRIVSFPKVGRNLATFNANGALTPTHLADWSQKVQTSGEDPVAFVRKKLFSPDGDSTQNSDRDQINRNDNIEQFWKNQNQNPCDDSNNRGDEGMNHTKSPLSS